MELPNDIIREIAKKLYDCDLFHFLLLNRKFKDGFDNHFWKERRIAKYGYYFPPISISLEKEKYEIIKGLSKFPLSMEDLYMREYLDIRFPYLPKEIGYLRNLRNLYLQNNGLNFLPDEIVNLENLQVISVSDNNLTSLPKEIGKLKNLKDICLYKNKFEYLPKEIGDWENLERLDVACNFLKSIPKEIGKLTKLINIYIENNKLTSLPIKEMCNMNNLRKIYVYDNNLSNVNEMEKEFGKILPCVAFIGTMSIKEIYIK